MESPSKFCQTCARPFADRKSWQSRGISDQIRYCSAACRRSKPHAYDLGLEARVMQAIQQTSVQPMLFSELALRLQVHEQQRKRLEWAVRRLALRGKLTLIQAGRMIDPGHARHPYHISLA